MKPIRALPFFLLLLSLIATSAAPAWSSVSLRTSTASLGTPLRPLLGDTAGDTVREGETLNDFAVRTGVGYGNLTAANPAVDVWLVTPGTEVILPIAVILPQYFQMGITINLAEMRLYHVRREDQTLLVDVYPIGIGREGLNSPEGDHRVVTRVMNPVWRPTERMRNEDPLLPALVPPGPDNPLGTRWLGLSAPSVGIHGTHKPAGVGRRVSSGCIRMYPWDVERLFENAIEGTPVRILYQPFKLGHRNGLLFIEAHKDYDGRQPPKREDVLQDLQRYAPGAQVRLDLIDEALRVRSGLPVVIGLAPPALLTGTPAPAPPAAKPAPAPAPAPPAPAPQPAKPASGTTAKAGSAR